MNGVTLSTKGILVKYSNNRSLVCVDLETTSTTWCLLDNTVIHINNINKSILLDSLNQSIFSKKANIATTINQGNVKVQIQGILASIMGTILPSCLRNPLICFTFYGKLLTRYSLTLRQHIPNNTIMS